MYKYLPEEVNVPLKRLQKEGFTQRDLEVHQDLFHYDIFRKAFGDENGLLEEYNLRYVGPMLIDIEDINNDSKYDRTQPYRAGANPEAKTILTSFEENGYALSEILPAVIYNKETDSYMFGDGRTRTGNLKVKEVPNVLVNCYELIDTSEEGLAKTRRFPMLMNTLGFSKGKATEEDVLTFLTQQAKKDENGVSQLELLYGEVSSLHDLKSALNSELKSTNMKLSTKKVLRLASELFEEFYGKTEVLILKDRHDARSYVEKFWGPEWKDNDKVKYVFVPADGKHGDNTYKETLLKMLKNGDTRELHAVLYETEVSTANPADQFRKKMLQAKPEMLERNKLFGEALFGGAKLDTSKYKVVAAVPYVVALNDEYPMEKPLLL